MHLYLLILYTYHLITIKPIRNMYLYIKFIQDLKEKKRTIDEAPYPNLTVYLFKLHRLPYFAPTAAPCCWRPANTASGVLGCMASIILDSVKK